ncbi:MAG: hypothetical protein OCD02_07270 [Spirochaetaceae bacterium]
MLEILCEKKYDHFLESRIKSIELNFNRLFWKDNSYSSEGVVDDRANALTVLVGLCPQKQYNKIKFVLGTKNHAWNGSPATIAFKYFMGIDTTDGFKTFTANPVPDLFEYQKIRFMLSGGEQITLEYKNNKLVQS